MLAQHGYAIVNTGGMREDDSKALQAAFPISPLVPGSLKSDAAEMPVLLAIDHLDDGQRKALLARLKKVEEKNNAHDWPACLIDAPEATHKGLALHLTRRLVLDSPRGKIFLRYFDPRVFPHLVRILPPERVCALFGPIQTWTIPFQKTWRSYKRPEITGIVPLHWWADAGQAGYILDGITLTNAVLLRWCAYLGRDITPAGFDSLAAHIDRALLAARHYGLHTKSDITAFALHAIKHGEHFHRHPRIQRLLEKIRQQKTRYETATARFGKRDWAEISAA
ncbi:MAG: DUF4123 domain-containing protein [Azoarcus sp.]|nr:DUF4123 domain-containing protein [Azoarcus sp.]